MVKEISKKHIFFLATSFLVGFFFFTGNSFAGAGQNTSGWGWSANIGWISFNSDTDGSSVDYGVNIDEETGAFSGYAWSENIGWVSFNPSDASGCPEASCSPATLSWSTGAASGWAKVLSSGEYIKLSGSWSNGVSLNLSTNFFSGYAWGGDVLGWVDFSRVGVLQSLPTMFLSASPNPVDRNSSATLSWSSTNTTSCSASGDWSGSKGTSGTEDTGNLVSAKTYTLSCTGPGGDVSGDITVSVSGGTQCSDTIDNDSDTWIDYPDDPGCQNSPDDDETNPPLPVTQCTDGINNDGVNGIDGQDPNCSDPSDDLEGQVPDFTLSRTNDIDAAFVADQAQRTSSTTIKVNGNSNFFNTVTLSVVGVSPNIPGNETYNFSDATLSSSEFAQGSQFSITIPNSIATRNYTITIEGTDGSITRTIDVKLNVANLDPTFEEF